MGPGSVAAGLESKDLSMKPSSAQDQAKSHRRTRDDHRHETAEDYVEMVAQVIEQQGLCRVVDLARSFGISHVTVTRTVARLQDLGYLDTAPYRPITLTVKGKRLAAQSRQRHELVYKFLLAIGVSPQVAATDAEGIEHHVSKQTLEQFQLFIESKLS
jgi:DtxR family transcriptional regulator, manganese transport regulator